MFIIYVYVDHGSVAIVNPSAYIGICTDLEHNNGVYDVE